jgi:hypothetical protein
MQLDKSLNNGYFKYVEHLLSLAPDFKNKYVNLKVLNGADISAENHATMDLMGNER